MIDTPWENYELRDHQTVLDYLMSLLLRLERNLLQN